MLRFVSFQKTALYAIVMFAIFAIPSFANAECRTVVWGSSSYNALVSQGWGPDIQFLVAPPAGTTVQLCSDGSSSPAPQPAPAPTNSCPTGTVAITSETRADATASGIPTSAQCWNPSDPNTGQTAGAAKLWLQQHATKNANISCLNSTFAENLQKLMQAAPGGPPTITDGYRSPQAQAQLPAGSTKVGPCGSYHQYGMAADFNNASAQTQQWLRVNASQYGLSPVTYANPTTGCTPSGFCDGGHIQNAGPRPPVNQCGMCASSGGDGTLPGGPGPTVPDDTNAQPPLQRPWTPSIPTQPQTPTTPQMPQTPATITPTTPTSNACTPQFSCTGTTIYFQSSSCTQTVYQTCQYGCSGTVCSPNPNSASSSGSSLLTPNTLGGSVQNLLTSLLTPTSSVSIQIATATPLNLSAGLFNVAQIGQPFDITTGQPVSNNPAIGSSTENPVIQTFTSPDLNTGYGYSPLGTSPLSQLLLNIRSLLSGILTFLVPQH